MPRNVTVTLSDGSTHVYNNVPDTVTPDQITARVQSDFGAPPKAIDGGRKSAGSVSPAAAPQQAAPKKDDYGWLQPLANAYKSLGLTKPITPIVKQAPGQEHAPGLRSYKSDPTGGLLTMFDEASDDLQSVVNQNLRSLGHDVSQPLDKKKGVLALPARVGKTALDVGVASITPAETLARTAIGRPVETMTKGKIKSETAADAALAAEGAYELAKSLPKIAPKVYEASRAGVRAVRSALTPASVSPEARATAGAIRKFAGRGALEADKAGATLTKMDKEIQRRQATDPEYFNKITSLMESRSKAGVPAQEGIAKSRQELQRLHELGLDSTDLPVVNAMKAIYNGYKEHAADVIKRNVGAQPNFVKDYYSHLWQEPPEKVEQVMESFARQGTGKSFKARSIPTIEDGIKAGLTPKYANPIENTLVYSQNMSNFLTTHEQQAWMKANNYAKWFFPGQQPAGWVKLEGSMTERVPRGMGGGRPAGAPETMSPAYPGLPGPEAAKPALRIGQKSDVLEGEVLPPEGAAPRKGLPGEGTKQIGGPTIENVTPEATAEARGRADRAPRKQVLYAPEDAARVYNNWISKGLASNTAVGKGYEMLLRGANSGKALKFGLSSYHALTMGWEAAISRVARGLQKGLTGKPLSGLRDIATSPTAIGGSAARGFKMQRQLLSDLSDASPAEKKINQLFVDSGGRLTMDKLYRTTESRNFYNNLKSGTLRRAISEAAQQMYGKDRTLLQKVQGHAQAVANLSGSLTAPLFEDIIPAIKRGAFAERMGDWLQANPMATEEQQLAYARKLNDSIDNRFGEMVQDNMFWDRRAKQIAQIALLSSSWTLGTVREIGGGLIDAIPSVKTLIQGKGISDRTAYVAALVGVVAASNAVMNYLKTGQGPKSVADLEAYRTGGKDPRLGGPERAMFPGYQKDVYAAMDAANPGSGGVLGIVRSKLDPTASFMLDMATNTDYAGRALYGPGAAKGALQDRIMNTYSPFVLDQALKGHLKGSKISPLEEAMGAKPAPLSITNPKALKAIRDRKLRQEKRAAERSQLRQKARRVQNNPTDQYLGGQ